MEDKKYYRECEAGFFVYGVSPIAAGVVFVETEDEARSILEGAAVPDQVLVIGYVYMMGFGGMALNRELLVTEDTRKRYYSDGEFAKKLKASKP